MSIVFNGPRRAGDGDVLTPEALAFLEDLHSRFDKRRRALLEDRAQRQVRVATEGAAVFTRFEDCLPDEAWRVTAIPADLRDRRVEITGPVDRKMIINALNSGANVFMADFEDATSPTWSNLIDGQVNLSDRWRGALTYTDPSTGKHYALCDAPAVLIVRPRGLHLEERRFTTAGAQLSGSLCDFGLYAFHNAHATVAHGSGPYFYLPKLEHWREAEWWRDVFAFTEQRLALPNQTIKATVLIETLPAAFQMEQILFALRDYAIGLNCGRWDYIFSFIKRLGGDPRFLTPDRAVMTMDRAFLRAYSRRLIAVCHRRGAFAMGGMAAQIPVKNDPIANQAAFERVRADKQREVADGHDGTWVAHPDLVAVAREVFDRGMPGSNQLDRGLDGEAPGEAAMLEMHDGVRSETGLRANIRVALLYVAAWLGGRGSVPIDALMEDAATAEIARAQLWQWRKHAALLSDGTRVSGEMIRAQVEDAVRGLREHTEEPRHLETAAKLLMELVEAEDCPEFLTLAAYTVLESEPPR